MTIPNIFIGEGDSSEVGDVFFPFDSVAEGRALHAITRPVTEEGEFALLAGSVVIVLVAVTLMPSAFPIDQKQRPHALKTFNSSVFDATKVFQSFGGGGGYFAG